MPGMRCYHFAVHGPFMHKPPTKSLEFTIADVNISSIYCCCCTQEEAHCRPSSPQLFVVHYRGRWKSTVVLVEREPIAESRQWLKLVER